MGWNGVMSGDTEEEEEEEVQNHVTCRMSLILPVVYVLYSIIIWKKQGVDMTSKPRDGRNEMR